MKDLLEIRLSHLLRHCSVGAIVRGPDMLMTVKDTRHWTDRDGGKAGRPLRYVERVRAALGIEPELREPPTAQKGVNWKVEGACIPARRFPGWAKCPHCGLLHHLPVLGDDPPLRCQEPDMAECGRRRRPRPEQVPYVLVHIDGHMDDLPWHHLAHTEARTAEQSGCRIDTRRCYLRLRRDGKDPSRSRLSCGRCGASVLFNPHALKTRIKFMRPQPWIRESIELATPPEIVKVNHVQVHIPRTRNALVIPPESRIRKGTVVDRLYNSARKRHALASCSTPLQRRTTLRGMARELRCPVEAVIAAWKQIQEGYPLYGEGFPITPGQLIEDEYRALIQPIPDVSDDEDFVTRHHTDGWQALASTFAVESLEGRLVRSLDRLIAVTRLKEILVLEGFSRWSRDGIVVKPDITGESDWLPAVELFGEGIFITLEPTALAQWENLPGTVSRARQTQGRYDAAVLPFQIELPEISPRFLLLHALSHLLIRQLECGCGYPAASLKERIYCAGGALPMAGILIYVAVPDVVGSLGGLVEMADPRRFLALTSAAVARSEWCSFDPVCLEQEGQGPHLLNRAACHCCLLVPDPCCGYQNTLLDRVFVKGDRQSGIPAFFGPRDFAPIE